MNKKMRLVSLCGLAMMLAACKTAERGVITWNYLQLPDPTAGQTAKPEHFVRDWLVLGPFTFETGKHGGEQDQEAANIEFVKKEASLSPREGVEVGGKKWVRYKNPSPTAPSEYIDLDAFFDKADYAAAYIGCYVHAPKSLDNLTFWTGSDDYETVWINGKRVHHYDKERRAPKPDQDPVRGVSLKKGWNVIVVKVVDVVKKWGFYGRFSDAKGNPMKVTDTP